MDVHLSLLSLIALSFFLTILAPSYCNQDENFKVCSRSYMCGNVSFSFPYWGGGRSKYCGLEGYKLECHNNEYPVMSFQALEFRVRRIDSSSGSITVARSDLLDDLCSPRFNNTILSYALFDYASTVQNITIFYGCPLEKVPAPNRFRCSAGTYDGAVNGFVEDFLQNIQLEEQLLANCENSTQIPVLESSALLREPSDVRAALSAAINGGFEVEYKRKFKASCTPCAASGGICGSNATGSFVCFCEDQTQTYTCTKRDIFNLRIQLTLLLGASLLVVVAAIIFYLMVCKKKGHFLSNLRNGERGKNIDAFNVEEIMKNFGSIGPKRYTYSDVKKMSNSFTDKVGQGGYGIVYKGRLLDGRIVAIKVLSEYKGDGEEFTNEVASISRTSHVNIVTLLGFCFERNKRALIYEFMPNGSLDKFICGKGSILPSCQLDINTMFKVVIGIARGLEYLHRGCNTRILHFDIKPHNILLDEDLCPKISNFGLAKLCKTKESIVSMMDMRGTPRYIAPEVFSRHFGRVSHKFDVYSYGMLILEMVGVRTNFDNELSHTSDVYFPYGVYNKLHNGESFGMFEDVIEEEEETIKKMTIVSLWCIQINPSDRPSMGKVIEMLEDTFQSLPFPLKPFLESPNMLPHDSSTASLSQNLTF